MSGLSASSTSPRLSRPPAGDEVQELKTILAQRGDREAGLCELVWALISSREFAENH
jgi:hypothetical protein